MIWLSIVIPVYNSANYLDDCLQSLLDQDIDPSEYEIICVNDGSKDNSLEILHKYAGISSSIKIIDQENGGHAAARNAGLFIAQGKYVWFVDSDDYIDCKCMKFLVTTLEERQIDFLTIGMENVPDESHYSPVIKDFLFKSGQIPQNISCSGNRIILRSLLLNNNIIWHEELSPNDDTIFLFYISIFKKNSIYLDSATYYWRQNPNSVTRKKSFKTTNQHLNSYLLMAKIYQTEFKKFNDDKKSPIRQNIKHRIGLTIKSILVDAAFIYTTEERIKLLDMLKKENLYPYPFLWIDVKPKISIKRTLMDWSLLFIPCKMYYLIFSNLIFQTNTAKKFRQ